MLPDFTSIRTEKRLKPPKWNLNADIDGNGVVDLSDLVILAEHYGQHNP